MVLILSISAGIMAFSQQTSVMGKIKKFSNYEIVEEVVESDNQNARTINNTNILKHEHVKEYMKKELLIQNDESDYKIQLVTNNLTNEKYYRMMGSGARIEIIQETGEVRSYINSKPSNYVSGTLYGKEKIKEVAEKIITTNDLLKTNKGYELIEIKEKDNYYPTTWFRDNINNKLMLMIFDPDSEEIIAIATKQIPISENNEIKLDEATAKNIAKHKVNLSEQDILMVEQKEVVPNHMFLESGYYYSQINIKRNAYVVTFNTISKLQVFVDATTGEIIGGDGQC